MSDEMAPLAVPTSVKERRKAKKWTQGELAARVGLSTTAIHNLEAGKNGFTDKTLAALASALGCRPADLLVPMTERPDPIRTEEEIFAFLKRIERLSETDVETALAVITNAIDAKRAEPEPIGEDGPRRSATRPHEAGPSRRQ